MTRLGLTFSVLAPEVDESAIVGASPAATAELRARAKADEVFSRRPDAIVIGADQLVDLEGTILGKPGSTEGAVLQLSAMAGKRHRLLTATAVLASGHAPQAHLDLTLLTMRPLPVEALRRYVAHDRPEGCAGSYRIEGQGIALFERIEGNDPTAIEGLPLGALTAMLGALGIEVP